MVTPSSTCRILAITLAFSIAACPAATGAEKANDAQPRLFTSNVGDWVLYKMPGGESFQKETLIAVEEAGGEKTYVIRYENIVDGKPVSSHDVRRTTTAILADIIPDDDPLMLSHSRGEIETPAGRFAVESTTSDNQLGGTLTVHYSDKVPLTGLVRADSSFNEEPSFELVEYGYGDGK